MNFKNKLISGLFVKRYKRFFVDVAIKGKIITAHCPNTGSMRGLIKEGNKVWLTKNNSPKRKLKYTLQIIEVNNVKVGVNTHLTNKIFHHALKNKLVKEFPKICEIKTEVKFGSNTRFDFLLKTNHSKIFIEIKNVTLSRESSLAEFPDSITQRGAKHINQLHKAAQKGYKTFIIFIVQREDCNKFKIAKDIDQNYSFLLSESLKKKLKILCYDCKFSPKGIKLNKQMKINLK